MLALVIDDYKSEREVKIYLKPSDQIREMRKLFESARDLNPGLIHECLDETFECDDSEEESDDEDDDTCSSCGRTCDCKPQKSPKDRVKWTREQHLQRIEELVEDWTLETPEQWISFLDKMVVGDLLDDVCQYYIGTISDLPTASDITSSS
jgi:hypothetical protein